VGSKWVSSGGSVWVEWASGAGSVGGDWSSGGGEGWSILLLSSQQGWHVASVAGLLRAGSSWAYLLLLRRFASGVPTFAEEVCV